MKILMIAPTAFFADRGCHVRIYEEARALQRCGHSILICTYPIGRDMSQVQTTRLINLFNYKKLSAGPSWHKIYIDFLLLIKVLRMVHRFKPKMIYAHLHEGAFWGIFVKIYTKFRGNRLPLIFDYQGGLTGELRDHHFIKDGSVLFQFFTWLEKWIEKRSDAIVTSSTYAARELRQRWHQKMIFPLVDGVDTDSFHPNIADPAIKRSLNLPDKCVVVFLGVLYPYQGIDLLLETIQLIWKQTKQLHFLIMGYPNVEHYQRKAAKLDITEAITFTGKIPYEQAASYLNLGDIAVSPKISDTEANGKLLNYMACGLPTIVFDTAINRELLEEDGVYAEYKNIHSLAEKILFLAENPVKRKEIGSKLRTRVVEHFSWQTQAKTFNEFLMKQVGDD